MGGSVVVELISTGSDFEKEFGYSRAVVDGEMVYVSGTTGYDYSSMQIPEDVAEQTRNTLKTIGETLEKAGTSLRDVVAVRYYLCDRADMDAIVPVVGAAFGEIRPAATMVICDLIRDEMKIEIEVTARKGAGNS